MLVGLALLVGFPVAVIGVSETSWWEHRVAATWRLLAGDDDRVVYSMATGRRAVALTIDDGPDPRTTPAILDVLGEHGARATFFLISGRVHGNERIVDRISDEGHEIGNHLTVDRPSIDMQPDEFEERLVRAHETLRRWQSPRWFRPGSGWYDDGMLRIAERRGYRTALGRVYPMDAAVSAPALAARFIQWRSEPGEIIILHDGGQRGVATARTLNRVLPALARSGLEVVPLSELSSAPHGEESNL